MNGFYNFRKAKSRQTLQSMEKVETAGFKRWKNVSKTFKVQGSKIEMYVILNFEP
jgi:hypothetical protein